MDEDEDCVSSSQQCVVFSLSQPSPQSNQPEILTVSFKKVKGSMGLSIVAAVVSSTVFSVV